MSDYVFSKHSTLQSHGYLLLTLRDRRMSEVWCEVLFRPKLVCFFVYTQMCFIQWFLWVVQLRSQCSPSPHHGRMEIDVKQYSFSNPFCSCFINLMISRYCCVLESFQVHPLQKRFRSETSGRMFFRCGVDSAQSISV